MNRTKKGVKYDLFSGDTIAGGHFAFKPRIAMPELKIIKSPELCVGLSGAVYLPPLAVSTIYAFLKEKGFSISQEDLNIYDHTHNDNVLGNKKKDKILDYFSDTDKFLGYFKSDNGKNLDDMVSGYIGKTTLKNVDILLISVFPGEPRSSFMALLIARYFKLRARNKIVIVGGEWLQRAYIYENFDTFNKMGIVDYYILGPGEESLLLLLKKIKGESVKFQDIPGLCYRGSNGEVKENVPGDKKVLVFPDFRGLHLGEYSWKQSSFFRKISKKIFQKTDILMLPFQMICGCPFSCAFCFSSLSKKIIHMDPKKAVAALKNISEKYKTRYFFFLHDTFNFCQEFVNDFCDEILKTELKIYWSDCVSAANIKNQQILLKMRKAGACRLSFGMETASPSLLRRINKPCTAEEVSQALRWAHESGIWTGLEIIAGFPHEREEDIYKTAEFIIENSKYIDEVSVNGFYLCEGSYMLRYPQKYGITNVRDCCRSANFGKSAFGRYAFDEIRGLKWEEKKKQIECSRVIINKIKKMHGVGSMILKEELNVLFYLYTYLNEKKSIKSFFNLYRADNLKTYRYRKLDADNPNKKV